MVTPQISLIAYEAWPEGKVFVRVPNERGRYMMCHKCVVTVECPQCKSAIGEPCKRAYGKMNYGVDTHSDRRVAYMDLKRVKNINPKPRYRVSDIELESEHVECEYERR